jgi:hypothetical protein
MDMVIKLSGGVLLIIALSMLVFGGAAVALEKNASQWEMTRSNLIEILGGVLIAVTVVPIMINMVSGMGSYRSENPAMCSSSFAPPVCDWEPPVPIRFVTVTIIGTTLLLVSGLYRLLRAATSRSVDGRSLQLHRGLNDLVYVLGGIAAIATFIAFSIDPGNHL